MATITETRTDTSDEQVVVLHGLSWETYEGLLCSEESQRGSVRMSFDRGRLVLMSPSQKHERAAHRIGLMVVLTAYGLGLNCMGVGSMTLKRKKLRRGKEPDTAFYLAREPLVRGKEINLNVDPPPDLAVEIEITHGDPEMLAIYAALGVPEVWHFDGDRLRVLHLRPGKRYEETPASAALPALPIQEIPRWLERAESEGEAAMVAAFIDWVRNELAPRAANQEP